MVARDWFAEIMMETFKERYSCAECVDEQRCEFWEEAYDCYWKDDLNMDEILQEFRKDDVESSSKYALSEMKEWRRRTVFGHEQGRRARWFKTGPS
jgi:hypothetical protein